MTSLFQTLAVLSALFCSLAAAQEPVIQLDEEGRPVKVRHLESELSVVKIRIPLGENRAPAAYAEPGEKQEPPRQNLPDALMSAAQSIPAQ